jgi:hypothetical protein
VQPAFVFFAFVAYGVGFTLIVLALLLFGLTGSAPRHRLQMRLVREVRS